VDPPRPKPKPEYVSEATLDSDAVVWLQAHRTKHAHQISNAAWSIMGNAARSIEARIERAVRGAK